MAIIGFTKLETLFRKAASLDIKKGHAKDLTDIIEEKLRDFLIAADRTANMNKRDVIWLADIPITKGMQESIIEFRKLEEELDIEDILKYLASIPPLKYPLSDEVEKALPEITGGLMLVLARTIKEVDENQRQVTHEAIEKAKKIIDLML